MKTVMNLLAVCMVVALIGCESTNSSRVSPGAVSECGAKNGEACTKAKSECCGAAKCDGEASMGAVGECSQKSECCKKACDGAAMGAVSECSQKSECQKACDGASMGAVSDCEAKKNCASSCTKSDASLGAVSEKSECAKSCKKSCGDN